MLDSIAVVDRAASLTTFAAASIAWRCLSSCQSSPTAQQPFVSPQWSNVGDQLTAGDLAKWAQDLPGLLLAGSAQQRKALLRKLIKELRVISRDEIVPTYKIPTLVRAPMGQVELRGFEPLASAMPWRRSTK